MFQNAVRSIEVSNLDLDDDEDEDSDSDDNQY
jgi:hypothetical protein